MGRALFPEVAAVSDAADAKSSWPELVGRHVAVAIAVIKAEREDVVIKLKSEGDAPPEDFDGHRVCLFLDHEAHVTRTPVVG